MPLHEKIFRDINLDFHDRYGSIWKAFSWKVNMEDKGDHGLEHLDFWRSRLTSSLLIAKTYFSDYEINGCWGRSRQGNWSSFNMLFARARTNETLGDHEKSASYYRAACLLLEFELKLWLQSAIEAWHEKLYNMGIYYSAYSSRFQRLAKQTERFIISSEYNLWEAGEMYARLTIYFDDTIEEYLHNDLPLSFAPNFLRVRESSKKI